ncbi:hypothetical protein PYW07_016867 [Mythimna separata]|uniref:Uncharacterized protein n=1 Tax=Mythimna separata TaxID=271217 RepID=A0AAD8DY05_MYTSE|nr:hypothetical protein PYW07_016867 [Mythimna separata]
MSVWRSVEEVMRDLSVAQGFVVPAPLKTFTGDGPPPYEVEEDSIEQSFYTSEGGGSGHFPAPNYKLIQNMLNMVHKDDQDESGAHSNDVDPAGNHTEEKAKAADLSARRPMSPSDMGIFILNGAEQAYNPRNGSVSSPPSSDKSKQYKPSANASAYYSKYLEKSNLREHLEEDLWTKLEREMKELEEKKKRKAELKTPKELGNVSTGDASDLFAVFELSLPEHRHVLPGDCVVCVVAAKHGFYF